MRVIVHEDRTLEIINQAITQNENDITIIDLEVPENYINWNKKIVFITSDGVIWDLFENNQYVLSKEITQRGKIKFYIWLTHEQKDFRSEIKTLFFNDNVDASGEITPDEIDAVNKILAMLDEALEEVDNVDIDVNKSGTISTVTISKKDGTSKSVNILDGERGPAGYTPQRGIDYWTNEDKQEILNEVNNDIQEYINQPFAEFEIVNGNLIAEVKEWQE